LLLITNQAEFFDLNHMIKIKKSDDLNHDLNLDLNQVDLNLRTLAVGQSDFSNFSLYTVRLFVRVRVEIVCNFKFSLRKNRVKCAIFHSGRLKNTIRFCCERNYKWCKIRIMTFVNL
jgi:hypothetical protein